MTNKSDKDPMKNSKRTALKVAVAGTVAAGAWTKPIVEAVVLPAHAMTSGGGGEPTGGTTAAPVVTTVAPLPTYFDDVTDSFTQVDTQQEQQFVQNRSGNEKSSLVESMADLLVSNANAQDQAGFVTLCVEETSPGDFDITLTQTAFPNGILIYTAQGAIDTALDMNAPLCPGIVLIPSSVTLSNQIPGFINVTVSRFRDSITVTLPEGPCQSETLQCPDFVDKEFQL